MIPSRIHGANRDSREGDLSIECLEVAPLLGLDVELGDEDESALVNHLALCRRCRSVLAQQASSTAASATGRRKSRTLAVAMAGVLAAAAVLTIVMLRGAGSNSSAEAPSSGQIDASPVRATMSDDAASTRQREAPKPASGRTLEPPPTSNRKSPPRRGTGSPKPETADATRRKPPVTNKASSDEFQDPEKSLAQHCSGEVADEQVAQCFLFACAAADAVQARRFLRRIDGESRRLKLKKVCAKLRADRP